MCACLSKPTFRQKQTATVLEAMRQETRVPACIVIERWESVVS